jgi:hypothetical protein
MHEPTMSSELTGAVESLAVVCYIILLTVDDSVVRYLCLIVAVSCADCA